MGGIKESQLFAAVSLTTVWLNLHEGPWSSQNLGRVFQKFIFSHL